MSRVKQKLVLIFISNFMSAFDQAKPRIIRSFSRNKDMQVEVVYKHSPEPTENLNDFVEKIRKDIPNLHSIVFEQLFWDKEETQQFFKENKMENVKGLYVENLGNLYRINEDGTLVSVPLTDLQLVVTH